MLRLSLQRAFAVQRAGLRSLRSGVAPLVQPLLRRHAATTTIIPPARKGLKGLFKSYLELSKYRLGSLVVFTTGAGFIFSSGNVFEDWRKIEWSRGAWCVMGTTLFVATANTLNQIIEQHRDALMARTKSRPLVLRRVSSLHAVTFAALCTVAGSLILSYHTNTLTTVLGLSNIVLYAFVYTPLKVIHPINTWVGAIVGAIPPMMGSAAVLPQGARLQDLGTDAWAMAWLLFAWQITHFLSLAHLIRHDYNKAGYKMLSISNMTLNAKLAMRYAVYMMPTGLLTWWGGSTSGLFAIDCAALSAYLAWVSWPFVRNVTDLNARRVFRTALWFLPAVMGLAILHATSRENRPNLKRLEHDGDKKKAQNLLTSTAMYSQDLSRIKLSD